MNSGGGTGYPPSSISSTFGGTQGNTGMSRPAMAGGFAKQNANTTNKFIKQPTFGNNKPVKPVFGGSKPAFLEEDNSKDQVRKKMDDMNIISKQTIDNSSR
jgi:hypothetical protein